MEKQNEQKSLTLKRTLGFLPALATVMGTVIGAGVFFKAGKVAADTGNVGLHLLAWLLGGLISICGGLSAAELAAAIPETGGMLRYIDRAYGKVLAFLLGWAQSIIYFPANIAALSLIFGLQLVNLLALDKVWIVPLAILAAVSVTGVNYLGSKVGGYLQSITLVLKLIPIALIVLVGLLQTHGVNFELLPIAAGPHLSLFPALGAALLATMFAYDGWIYAGNVAGELKRPARDLPRAIIMGLVGVMIVYLLVNTAFIHTLGMDQLMQNTGLEPEKVAHALFGGLGGKLVTIGILISVYGGINGYTLTGMRIPYVMAKEKTIPFSNQFEKLNAKTRVPINAGLLQLVIAALMILISLFSADAFNLLTDMLVFVIWIFYTLVFVAVFILRKKEPDLARPYKVPLYPFIPILAILGGFFIVVMTLYNQPLLALIGLGVTLVGLPIYFYREKKRGR